MSTPTISMRIFGEMQRAKGLQRVRHLAAKKAWQTRRKLAKASSQMLAVMWSITRDRYYLSLCHTGGGDIYGCRINGINADGSSFLALGSTKVSYNTFRALEKRGWLKSEGRRVTGSGPDSKGRICESFDLDYRLSDKGQSALWRISKANLEKRKS